MRVDHGAKMNLYGMSMEVCVCVFVCVCALDTATLFSPLGT